MGTTDGAVREHKRTHAQKYTQPIRPLTDLLTGSIDINMKSIDCNVTCFKRLFTPGGGNVAL